jgi:E3 ubiquitin-protein ligase HECTD4
MKLAPSDKRDDPPDEQNIRVETCMFMVKLPRYSSNEKMREKLLFAINSALDPLSG